MMALLTDILLMAAVTVFSFACGALLVLGGESPRKPTPNRPGPGYSTRPATDLRPPPRGPAP
jgi:hypothetical protein